MQSLFRGVSKHHNSELDGYVVTGRGSQPL